MGQTVAQGPAAEQPGRAIDEQKDALTGVLFAFLSCTSRAWLFMTGALLLRTLPVVAKAKRSMEDVAKVDGVEYRWHIHREPQWASVDGAKGLCLSVQHAENPQKVLLLEYPFPKPSRHAQRPKIDKRDVALQIGKAIADGWEPESRGKPFTYMIEG